MKILVCIKQVVNLESEIKIDPQKTWVQINPSTDFTFNRFDEYAVEEAVLIKEKLPETTIDILSIGPERAVSAIKRLQGLGADHGIHIITQQEGYLSPFVVAQWIASVVRMKTYDLIFTGVMSEDEMQGLVGPLTASFLEWPCATSVIHEEILPDLKRIRVEREIESGFKDVLEMTLPAVITIQSGINEPRYPTLTHMLRAKREKLEVIDAGLLECPLPRQTIHQVDYPKKMRAGVVLEGSPKEKASHLLTILNQRAII